jgi:methylitaconate Delta-isomerase
MVSVPSDYETDTGKTVDGRALSIVCRVMFMQKMHKAYPGTGSICTAVACLIPGTTAHEVAALRAQDSQTIVIGHPSGTVDVEVGVTTDSGGAVTVTRAVVGRTARKLLDGQAYLD